MSLELENGCGRRITQFVRKLRGGAQASLVVTNDGTKYAVKFGSNVQGENLLFNETLGSALYRVMGLPTADWTPLYADDQFLDENRGAWFELPSGKRRPSPGFHFGSKIVGDNTALPYELIPRSWFSRIENRDQFWGALVLDIWAEHTDNRQAIFTKRLDDGTLHATFIDHGHMFRGAGGDERVRPSAAMFLDLDVYGWLGAKDTLEKWMASIRNLDDRVFEKTLALVPLQWRTQSTEYACERLMERRARIEDLVQDGIERLNIRYSHSGSTACDKQLTPMQYSRRLAVSGSHPLKLQEAPIDRIRLGCQNA